MSGFDVAGVVIGILPLLINQLDNYVRGIESLKSFRSRRYRIELMLYCTRIRTQKCLLLNTLETALEDIGYEDDIDVLINDPEGPLWKDEVLEARLRREFGRDYDAFVGNLANASTLLQELCQRLGLSSDSMDVCHRS
ncbi:hypothetical protein PHISCL_09450 [Aspergillus sclerotialis]|uniref:Uncharacterized protein n=1 Tax=Aspergillus sclerotialis TaxID=2070753 RepID=A0A3A2Z7P6_9EURO|nr:hypothetical protein PHISCL_09450 [Aspergillus sclerotialis]